MLLLTLPAELWLNILRFAHFDDLFHLLFLSRWFLDLTLEELYKRLRKTAFWAYERYVSPCRWTRNHALVWAVQEGMRPTVERIVAMGVNLDAGVILEGIARGEPTNALHQAVRINDLSMVDYLLQQGANVNATIQDELPIHHASTEAVARKLVGAGSPVNYYLPRGNISLLAYLIDRKVDTSVIKALLELGAEPITNWLHLKCAAYAAARSGNVDALKLLIGSGL
ncbi:hypothetical protein AB5N19_12788 [Seiridium cardinale]|uniref:F-box domain-containing protein n=1 Tax=Seiridium cardinale TaxID=138064 RepID=A0ABR2Y0S0_9PEZI